MITIKGLPTTSEPVFEVLNTIFPLEAFEIYATHDGAQGIHLPANPHPDVILQCLELHIINGHEVIQTLPQRDKVTAIPFVLLACKNQVYKAVPLAFIPHGVVS